MFQMTFLLHRTTVLNYFEIHAQMYKIWPGQIRTDGWTYTHMQAQCMHIHRTEVVTTMSPSLQAGLTKTGYTSKLYAPTWGLETLQFRQCSVWLSVQLHQHFFWFHVQFHQCTAWLHAQFFINILSGCMFSFTNVLSGCVFSFNKIFSGCMLPMFGWLHVYKFHQCSV